jgi:esterase/lipase superfamily enzyme
MWNYSNIWSAADYHRNEDHCAAAEKRFVELVNELEGKLDVTKIGALAHSMGNRLLDAYIVQRHAKNSKDPIHHPQLMLLEFANADLSTIRASGNLPFYTESAVKCRIYVDNEDPALEASRKIHSGNRVGAPHAQLDLLTSKEILAPDVIDHVSISGKTHDLPFWLCSDLSNFGGCELTI